MARGNLKVSIQTPDGALPVTNAIVRILEKGTDKVIEEGRTNSSGQIEDIPLDAPPEEYSLNENLNLKGYSEYDMRVIADGYENAVIRNVQIMPNETSIQNVIVYEQNTPIETDIITIEDIVVAGVYPKKIPEDPIKDEGPGSGFVVLDRPVIPQYIIVHNGRPNDAATNYKVPFTDYIKNVASSEIYSTWPYETIKANVYAILSFTLNRVYTEWYRNKGYDFTITSSTAYDQAYQHGRTIYSRISFVVDQVFTSYVSKSSVRQPYLTQYCDGKNSTCPNWLSQWGSKSLGDKGYMAVDILKYYYGSGIGVYQAPKVSGIPSSYPGTPLRRGSRGNDVKTIQNQLNTINKNYPGIPRVVADGIFGAKTEASVKKFQEVFNLPKTGIVDFATWYKISQIYVAVSRLGNP